MIALCPYVEISEVINLKDLDLQTDSHAVDRRNRLQGLLQR